MRTTVDQAIAVSKLTDGVVTLRYTPKRYAELSERCDFQSTCHRGFSFDGGSEAARNLWTVILEKAK